MKRKERVCDRYIDEKRPGVDLSFIEINLPENELDLFLKKHASSFMRRINADPAIRLVDRKRRDKLMYKIYRAASIVLTNRQFQIFILRYKFGLLETEIARQVNVIQPYVSNILRVCHKKIRRALHLEFKKRRNKCKSGKPSRNRIKNKNKIIK